MFTFKRTADDATTFGHFAGILVDGKAVPEKDASGNANWTAKSGSAIVSLQPAYLATLAKGDHALTALFDDGDGVDASFTVGAKDEPSPEPAPTPAPDKPVIPKTGDGSGGTAAVLLASAFASLLALAACVARRRRDG